ncbi:hypothetical protein [Flavobacterium cellulosilyticum]|nr:hypothetical protein [Flavobacterium cellulosilyticum]
MTSTIYDFVGDKTGDWNVTSMATLMGNPIPLVSHLSKVPSNLAQNNT